jgi:hypothetical protein
VLADSEYLLNLSVPVDLIARDALRARYRKHLHNALGLADQHVLVVDPDYLVD